MPKFIAISTRSHRAEKEKGNGPSDFLLSLSLFPHSNSNLIAKVAAAKNAPLSLNLTNEHFSGSNFGINPGPKLPDIAKGRENGRKARPGDRPTKSEARKQAASNISMIK